MKNTNTKTSFENHFTVTINDINNSRALLPFILYKKMEQYAQSSAFPFKEYIISRPILLKLNLLKNAYLNDQLQLDSPIKKLNSNELQLSIEVRKIDGNSIEVICKALFSFALNGYQINNAS
jgi:hypothetical protein